MSDEEIVLALQNRDCAVISAVIAKYSRLLWKIAGEVLHGAGSEADAEECQCSDEEQGYDADEDYDLLIHPFYLQFDNLLFIERLSYSQIQHRGK